MKYTASALALAGMAATVRAHGFITSPQARMPGAAFQTACGQQVYYNQVGDNYGNVQGELQVAATQSDYDEAACDIWLCKGFKYADNTANVQSYAAGQVVDFTFDIRAPHTGVANVSIVDTATNTIIGSPLVSWDVFASNSNSDYSNETSFSITIPSDLGDSCSTAGACVIQHYWNAASIDQTYESCVDFTVGGSGSSSASSSSAVSSSAVASTSTVASTSIAANTAVVSTSAAASSAVSSTLVTSVASSTSTTSVAATAIVSEIASAIPSSVLTSTISATSATATSSANGTTSTMKPIPEGLTLGDILEWISYLFAQKETTYSSATKRHVRDFKA